MSQAPASSSWSTSGGAQRAVVASELAPFFRRSAQLVWTSGLAVAAAVGVGALIVLLWADLISPMSAQLRWTLTRVGMLVWLLSAAGLIWRRVRALNAESLAWMIDQKAQTGGELLTGLQLELRPPDQASDLTRSFAQTAASSAGSRLKMLDPASILPSSQVRTPVRSLGGMLVAAVGLSTIFPGVAWNQWQRFLMPWRDVPPYTGVVIEVDPLEVTVLYGQDVNLHARVVTGKADVMQLVTVDAAGRQTTAPMLPESPGSWQAVLTRVTEPLEYFAVSGRTRSRRGSIHVEMVPKILASEVKVQPPAYTHRAAFVGPIPEQGIAGVQGTEVTWTLSSNRPLKSGRLVITAEDGSRQELTLSPVEESSASSTATTSSSSSDADVYRVAGGISLTQSARFELSVVDVQNRESLDRISGRLVLVPDGRPVVRIVEPRPMSLATPDVKLPVTVIAEDDFGITRVDLYRALNGTVPLAMPMAIQDGPRQEAHWVLDLPAYRLQPGDEIRLFARAEDNDPRQAKGAESPVTVVRIISVEQMQEMMVQQRGAESMQAKYQAANRYLEQLAERLREAEEAAEKLAQAAKDPSSSSPAEAAELQQKLQAAQQAAAEAADAIHKLSQHPMPVDVDRELSERLAQLASETKSMSESLSKMASSAGNGQPMSPSDRESLQKMAEQLGGNRQKLQDHAIDPLGKMQAAMPLMVAQQEFVQMAAQQRDLATRLESLRSADPNSEQTQCRVAELESEQQQLRDSLNGLLDKIESQSAALPDDEEFQELKKTAKEFAQAVRASGASNAMSSAQQDLLKDQFPGASDQARQAAEILEKFIAQSEQMSNCAGNSCRMAFRPQQGGAKLGDSLQQLMAMMGMKPGSRAGQRPGMGLGSGMGGGYASRMPGPQNVGLYGGMISPQTRSGGGKSDRTSQGVATNAGMAPQDGGAGDGETSAGVAGGQAEAAVPTEYRGRVADYFERLAEELGNQP